MEEAATMGGGGRRERGKERWRQENQENMTLGPSQAALTSTQSLCSGSGLQLGNVDIDINRTLLLSSGTSKSVLGDNKKNG